MSRNSLRRAGAMADSFRSAPFSRAVFQAMRKLYPENLADKSWDNTGLLLEAPFDPLKRQMNSVLLTVDLTRAVADEAIRRHDSVVVAYHPIIFRGLKALTLQDSQQQSLLRLAAEGISVYSPHTALDSAPGGINDWLADVVTGSQPASNTRNESERHSPSSSSLGYQLSHFPTSPLNLRSQDFKLSSVQHTREAIKPLESETHPGAGQGRLVRFQDSQSLSSLIDTIASGMGDPKAFSVAIPQGKSIEDIDIRSVGICAGSGGGLLNPLRDVDVLFTGELSHHEALAAIERGQVVIALFHTNSERGFLHAVLRSQLEEQIVKEWETMRYEERVNIQHEGGEIMDALNDEEANVEVSEKDRDPYGIVVLQ